VIALSVVGAVLAWMTVVPLVIGATQAGETPTGDEIRAEIERYFADFMHPDVSQSGVVSVRERDGDFDIVIPGVVIGDRKGGVFDIGDITATARPLADGDYRVTAAIPGKLTFRDENGKVDAVVAIGKQRFEGVWAPEFDLLVQFDAAFEGIRVNPRGGPSTATIGTLAVNGAAVETSPGLWRSPSMVLLDKVRFGDGNGGRTITIGGIEMRNIVDGMKLDTQRRFARQIAEGLKRELGNDSANAGPLALLRAFDALPRLFSDLSTEITFNDIVYRRTGGARTFGLARVFQSITMRDLDRDLAHVDLRYEHSGLDIANGNGVPAELVPSDVILEVAASRLPNQRLRRAWSDWMKASTTSTPEFAQALLTDRISAAVLGAGSKLKIDRLSVEGPEFALESDGAVQADTNALYNIAGKLDATVRGMDRLVAAMSAAAGKDREAKNVAAVLSLIQALGVIETDENGGVVRRYRIEVPADGALVLNGNNLSTILGVMGSRTQ
jgi:hypothetical protein